MPLNYNNKIEVRIRNLGYQLNIAREINALDYKIRHKDVMSSTKRRHRNMITDLKNKLANIKVKTQFYSNQPNLIQIQRNILRKYMKNYNKKHNNTRRVNTNKNCAMSTKNISEGKSPCKDFLHLLNERNGNYH